MTDFQSVLSQPVFQSLGWALLHFFWQGTLAGLALAVCNFALRDSSARIRYAAGCVFLLVMLALPVATFLASFAHGASAPAVTPQTAQAPGAVAGGLPAAVTRPEFRESIRPLLPWTVALWIAGVILLSLRWIGAWTYLGRLRRLVTLPIPAEWDRTLCDLLRRSAVSAPVRLCIHSAVQAPCVIGWLRPVILVPAAALAGLDWRAFEALLAHELAHIRRHDYLVNLLQTAVDTLLFYHPAVWWASRLVRMERENCCDDIAAGICGDRVIYARALIDLEELRPSCAAFAMSAGGGSLTGRIQRLLGASRAGERGGPAWLSALAGLAVAAYLLAGVHSPARAGGPTRQAFAVPHKSVPAPAALPPAPRPVRIAMAAQEAAKPPAAEPQKSPDFLTGIVAAGFRNLTVDELIDLKIHGVTPQFAAAIKNGFANVTPRELVELSIHGVDPASIQALHDAGLANLSIAGLVRLRIHGVTPDYVAEIKDAGYSGLTVDEYQQLRIHGVDAAFIRHLNESGFKNLRVEQLVRLKRAGL